MRAALLFLACHAHYTASVPLHLDADGHIKLVQFTDMHYGEDAGKDKDTNALQATVLSSEKPQFAVFSGDAVSGYAWPSSRPSGWYEQQWRTWTQPTTDAGVPYAYTLGNHDDQADLNRSEIISLDMTNTLSLTQAVPPAENTTGVTNYVIDIMTPDGKDVAAHIFFFDSMDTCLGVQGWGCVYPDTVAWYSRTVNTLAEKHGRKLPSIGFYHIPLDEMMGLMDGYPISGNRTEDICCGSVNTGLYAAMVAAGNMHFISAGHDHNNDFFGELGGITLAYGRKTGFGGYGPPAGWLRGSRVLDLHVDNVTGTLTFDTWIRQEDGSRMDQHPHKPSKSVQQTICCGASGAPPSKCSLYEAEFRRKLQ